MALKAIILRKRLDEKKKALCEIEAKERELKTRAAELEAAAAESSTDEELDAVEEEVDAYEKEAAALEDDKTELVNEIESIERELKEAETTPPVLERGAAKTKEEGKIKMNIRALPKHVRAFDALTTAEKNEIVQREDVKEFLSRMRGCMSEKRAISGGDMLIPTVLLELISENMYRYSKLVNRVRVRQVRGEARQTIAGTVPEAVWTEMCGAINELSFNFNQIVMDGYKVAGYVPVCNALLQDSDIDLAAWIVEMISESIGLAKDKAILYGKGSGSSMPLGIVTRLAQTAKPSGYPANAPAWVDLHTSNIITIDGTTLTGAEFWAKLMEATGNTYSPYARGELFWAMNSKTLATLKSKLITFTATGDIAANLYGTLPIITGNVDILEFIPDGDIIGGYGDLYLWAERGAMAIDMSTEVQFIQDNTVFRGKERTDGAPIIPGAFVAININNVDVTTVTTFTADTANDAKLAQLTVGSESLAFNPDIYYYDTATTAASVKVEAVAAQAGAEVTIACDGKSYANGATISLALGSATAKIFDITITVRNGNAVRVYTVQIMREATS